jgi:GntR family histidine utilization transcriptional repressor
MAIFIMDSSVKVPRFLVIKQYLENHINTGNWPAGTRVPSENELAETFSVSRMTARRALAELDRQGLLLRSPGSGSFVKKIDKKRPKIELINVAEDLLAAGLYRCRVLSMDSIQSDSEIASTMEIDIGENLFKAIFLYSDGEKPRQLEYLYVNPSFVPAFMKQNYEKISPSSYIDWITGGCEPEYQLNSVIASPGERRELALTGEGDQACTKVTTRARMSGDIVSLSAAINPAKCYQLQSVI